MVTQLSSQRDQITNISLACFTFDHLFALQTLESTALHNYHSVPPKSM